jgi:S-adenosylmethionine synthetase
MIEKVNPSHPDKMADRIAGAIVDLAYSKNENPKVAVEVLIGHGVCHVIAETSEIFTNEEVDAIVKRIAGDIELDLVVVPQDIHLATNQSEKVRCGDNGIFKGVPLTNNEKNITSMARYLYNHFTYDGKYILTDNKFIICQSNASNKEIKEMLDNEYFTGDLEVIINPLGEWTGGTDVDTGATNRKLGSDMAQSVTGGGLHGKDLSKADVSVNIYAFRKAQETGEVVSLNCAIGDETIDGKPYGEIVEEAREFINSLGGFEKFAEWGLF